MILFKADGISKRFSEKFVLQNFSFEIHPGDKLNISGKSGIGKTTLFRLLLGFETPDSGQLFFDEKPLIGTNVWNVRKNVAYVSQDLNIGRGTVQSLFDETLHYKVNQTNLQKATNRISYYLTYFELSENILTKAIEELSGGEKQRIAIVNALLLNRKIYFLDEITSALDPDLKAKTLSFFLSNPDFTVLYISHDQYLPENTLVKTIKLDDYE